MTAEKMFEELGYSIYANLDYPGNIYYVTIGQTNDSQRITGVINSINK